MIAGQADEQALLAKGCEARSSVGVQVLLGERLGLAGDGSALALRGEVEAGPEDLEAHPIPYHQAVDQLLERYSFRTNYDFPEIIHP